MNGLQPMPKFEPKSDPANKSARWTQRLLASNVKDNARQGALLFYQAGPEVHEIFKTLPEPGVEKITKQLSKPLLHILNRRKNRIYQTCMFRQAVKQDNETIDKFDTRLRRLGLAKYCEFADVKFEIKMQIVCNGTSSIFRYYVRKR